jgi:hypothetical protein
MTTPAVATIKRSGKRWYVHPKDGSKSIGVTSVLNELAKPFLQYWSAKVVAEECVDNLGAVMNLVTADNRGGAVDFLKRAPGRSSGAAADTGTHLHSIVESINRGDGPGYVPPELQPTIDHYNQFLADWEPEWVEVEATGFNHDLDYAGTMDGIAVMDGDLLLVDLKTGKGIYEEIALQLNAYANFTELVSADGTSRPMPAVTGALALHLRPEGYRLIPVRLGDDIQEVFKSLIHLTRWDSEIKKGVLGTPQTPTRE